MTKKELRQVEDTAKKIIEDMLEESGSVFVSDYEDEACFPTTLLEEMEAFMGEEVIFMGIA